MCVNAVPVVSVYSAYRGMTTVVQETRPLYMYCGPSIAVFVNASLSITLDSLVIKNCIFGECKTVQDSSLVLRSGSRII